MIKRLFIDIETSPNICYSWRIGQKVFLDHNSIIKERAVICICYKWEHERRVKVLEWDNGDDSKMIAEIMPILSEADEVIGHNGDNFDLPWINTRAIKFGIKPASNYSRVDTLKMARRYFYFNSNKLDYLAAYLFGDKKLETGGYSLWKEVIDGKKSSLKKMVDYCKKDVILLEMVFNKLLSYSTLPSHAGVYEGNGRWSCPECGSVKVKKNKTRFTKAGMRRHEMLCHDCSRFYTITDMVFNHYINRHENMENVK